MSASVPPRSSSARTNARWSQPDRMCYHAQPHGAEDRRRIRRVEGEASLAVRQHVLARSVRPAASRARSAGATVRRRGSTSLSIRSGAPGGHATRHSSASCAGGRGERPGRAGDGAGRTAGDEPQMRAQVAAEAADVVDRPGKAAGLQRGEPRGHAAHRRRRRPTSSTTRCGRGRWRALWSRAARRRGCSSTTDRRRLMARPSPRPRRARADRRAARAARARRSRRRHSSRTCVLDLGEGRHGLLVALHEHAGRGSRPTSAPDRSPRRARARARCAAAVGPT